MVLCVPPTISATTSTKVWNPNNHRFEVPLDMVETKLCADAAGQCLHWASAHSHICSTTEQWQSLTSSQVFSLLFPLIATTPEGRNKKPLIPVYSCSYRNPHPAHLKPPNQGSPERFHTIIDTQTLKKSNLHRKHTIGATRREQNPQGFKRRARTSIQKNLNRQSSAAAACDSSTIAAWQDP